MKQNKKHEWTNIKNSHKFNSFLFSQNNPNIFHLFFSHFFIFHWKKKTEFEKKFILHRIANPKLFDISFTCLIGDFDFLNNLIQENFKFVEKFKKKLKADGQLLIKFTVSSKKPLSRINEIFKNIPNIDSLEISEIHEWFLH